MTRFLISSLLCLVLLCGCDKTDHKAIMARQSTYQRVVDLLPSNSRVVERHDAGWYVVSIPVEHKERLYLAQVVLNSPQSYRLELTPVQ